MKKSSTKAERQQKESREMNAIYRHKISVGYFGVLRETVNYKF